MNDLVVGIFIAALVHGVMFFSFGEDVSKPEFSVNAALSSIEVVLASSHNFAGKNYTVSEDDSKIYESDATTKVLTAEDVFFEPSKTLKKEICLDALSRKKDDIQKPKAVLCEDVNLRQGAEFLQKPCIISNPSPVYPGRARRKGIEGVVMLRAVVSADGKCKQVAVLESSGYIFLDKAAEKAVLQWFFKPAVIDGEYAESYIDIPVIFKLEKRK